MGKSNYWKGLEELNQEPEFLASANEEFSELLPSKSEFESVDSQISDTTRRDFLKAMGFTVAAVSLAACEAPTRYAIPYVNKPEDVDPGIANYYASTYVGDGEITPIVVKTREGRPIKIEGNKLSEFTNGGTSARAQASVLSLYDSSRLTSFQHKKRGEGAFSGVTKDAADKYVIDKLKQITAAEGQVRIIANTIASPTTQKLLVDFTAAYPTTKVVSYDALSVSGLAKAHQGLVPSYDFSKVACVASFGADFLGTWLSPVAFSTQFAETRKLSSTKKSMSKLFQFEANMSLTGANADERFMTKPSREPYLILALYNIIARKFDAPLISAAKLEDKETAQVKKVASKLIESAGKSLVISSSNDDAVQLIVKRINELLSNYEQTLSIAKPLYIKQGDDTEMVNFVSELNAGKIDAVITLESNPVYDFALGKDIENGLKKTKLVVSVADRLHETSSLADVVCASHHYLESWGDAEIIKGSYSLIQPTIQPLYENTRAKEDNLLSWIGSSDSFYDYLVKNWKTSIASQQSLAPQEFWLKSLESGVFKTSTVPSSPLTTDEATLSLSAAANRISATYTKSTGLELVTYEKIGLGSGAEANNPWLQELPDPVTKAVWDNYLTVSVAMAEEKGWKDGSVVNLIVKGKSQVKLPVLVQPGQAPQTVGLALGYGREKAGPVANGEHLTNSMRRFKPSKRDANVIGANAYPFLGIINGLVSYSSGDVEITDAGEFYAIARTQTQQTIMGRNNVQETNLAKFVENPKHIKEHYKVEITTAKGKVAPKEVDIWKPQTKETHKYNNHHWGLAIDLNTCFGCSACVVSCHAENNVPVVGKDEVLRKRDMHWLRIDRYYRSAEEMEGKGEEASLDQLSNPAENPEVVFQPMMCQHCNHAPCETVCPVLATTHSTEGLNQMTYNRCIGTRYCANNCPYKVRRFNWFAYYDAKIGLEKEFKHVNVSMNDAMGKMVLNPDVTVRARGVMEKCSMCVQRIQAGKLKAKIEKRKLKDGDIETACAEACPNDSIVFGDMNDPKSRISMALNEENADRKYHVLEELNVSSNVSYMTKVRNKG